MQSKKDKEQKINTFSDNDKETIKIIARRLSILEERKVITEESVSELETILVELLNMKDKHQKHLLRWVKQGYILD
jgi:uncharacterized coiled-coil protein SlyX